MIFDDNFAYFFMKTYVVACGYEAILMSTHNIGFYEEVTKIIFQLSSNTHLIYYSIHSPSAQQKTVFSLKVGSSLPWQRACDRTLFARSPRGPHQLHLCPVCFHQGTGQTHPGLLSACW